MYRISLAPRYKVKRVRTKKWKERSYVSITQIYHDHDLELGLKVAFLTLHLHVNAGGFYDARPVVSKSGWKSSIFG